MRKGLFAALFALVGFGANVGLMTDLFSHDAVTAPAMTVAAAAPVQAVAPKVETAKTDVPAVKGAKNSVAPVTASEREQLKLVAMLTKDAGKQYAQAVRLEQVNAQKTMRAEQQARYRAAMQNLQVRMSRIHRVKGMNVELPAPPSAPEIEAMVTADLNNARAAANSSLR